MSICLGKLPLRMLPHEAFNICIAESTVFFRSFALPKFGLTSTRSTASRRPVRHNSSMIYEPSRKVRPPGTKIFLYFLYLERYEKEQAMKNKTLVPD